MSEVFCINYKIIPVTPLCPEQWRPVNNITRLNQQWNIPWITLYAHQQPVPVVTASTGLTDNWTGPFILFIILILLLHLHFDLQKNKQVTPLKQSVCVTSVVCLRHKENSHLLKNGASRRLSLMDESKTHPIHRASVGCLKSKICKWFHFTEKILNHSGVK